MAPTTDPPDSIKLRRAAFRVTLIVAMPAALLAGLFLVHAETAWLVLGANLFGLLVAWFVTRVGGLPRDGTLRSERRDTPPVAGRIAPDA